MSEFFGIGGYKRTPEGFLSWQHLLFVTVILAAGAVLAVALGRRNREKDEKSKNRVLMVSAIVLDCIEIFYVAFVCISEKDPRAILLHLPLFLCSIMLIAIPISSSIGHGIGLGMITYTVMKLFTGKAKEVSVLTYIISVLFLVKFFLAI